MSDKNSGGSISKQSSIEARALQIRATGLIVRSGDGQFRVPSQSENGKYYVVTISDHNKCTCAYYAKRRKDCKHIIAAKYESEEGSETATDDAGAGNGTGDADPHRCSLNCKCGQSDKCAGVLKEGKRCGCKCKCRNDPKAYDAIAEEGVICIMLMIMEIMDMLKIVPYELGTGFGGRRGYDPKKMFAIIMLKTLVGATCRGMAGYLRDHPNVCRTLDLPSIPSKNTIARAYKKTSHEYIRILTKMIAAEIDIGDAAVDSTGKSRNMYEPWSTVKKEDGLRKGYRKLHIIIDITTRLIIDLKVTKSNMPDITVFREFLERFDWSARRGAHMCADAAYLARDICTLIEELGYVPLIMPKINSIARAKGHPAWRTMIKFYQNAYDEFVKEYGKRSIVESVFGAIKKVYGNGLRMRLEESQVTEILLEALCYNATYIRRNRFSKNECVYPEQPRLETYLSRGLDSNRTIADTGPDVEDVISTMIQNGILQVSSPHDRDDVYKTIDTIQAMYKPPLFYPQGSQEYNAVRKTASTFKVNGSATGILSERALAA